MTERDRLVERRVSAWFADEAPPHAPDELLETVFARTSGAGPAWVPLTHAVTRGLRPLALGAAVLLVAVVVVLGARLPGADTGVTGGASPSPISTPASSPAVSPSSLTSQFVVIEQVSVCAGASGATASADAIWVSCPDGLQRIDPVASRAGPTQPGIGIAASGPAGLWAVVPGGVAPIDPGTARPGKAVPIQGVSRIAVGDTTVWATAADGSVSQIDPSTGRIVSRLEPAGRPVDLAISAGSIWVLLQADGEVLRLDAATGAERARIAVTTSATRLGVGDGRILVVDPGRGDLVSIDTATNVATLVAATPDDPGALTEAVATSRVLYYTDRTSLSARDTATGTEIATRALPGYAVAVALFGGDPWVLSENGVLTHTHLEGG